MHGQDWELSVQSAAGSELHKVTAGGSSGHTGAVRAPLLPWGPCSAPLTPPGCQGAELAPEEGSLSWVLWMLCDGIWIPSGTELQQTQHEEISFAAQIIQSDAELPRETPPHCWDSAPCVCWDFSLP